MGSTAKKDKKKKDAKADGNAAARKTYRRSDSSFLKKHLNRSSDSGKDVKATMDAETRRKYTILGIAIAIASIFVILALSDVMMISIAGGAPMSTDPIYENEFAGGHLVVRNGKVSLVVSEKKVMDPETDEQAVDKHGQLEWERKVLVMGWLQWFLLAYMAFSGPVSIQIYIHNRRINRLEDRLGDFLRDIAESSRSGQTLHQSIMTAAGGSYGALSDEIEKMAMQISWGVNATVALERFAQRVRTPLVQRAATLIIEASNAGGEVAKVLDAAAIDTREIQLLKRERKLEMSTYLVVIFVSFSVFIAVIFMVYATFVPQMMAMAKSFAAAESQPTMAGLNPVGVDFGQIRLVFALSSVVQAIGDGLAAGLMSSGKISEGLKFSFFMVLGVFLAFTFLLPFLV